MKSIDDVYKKYPTNTLSKFAVIAKRYGFTKQQAKEYLDNRVVKDKTIPPPQFMHIYSKTPGSYQMDTFINDKAKGGINYLMFINVNTRKAYAYPMNGKGANQVKQSLEKFIKECPLVHSILSDQDKAYLSNEVLSFMKDNNINYKTTDDNDHNKLGIINRFMRTIRDFASRKDFDKIAIDDMNELISTYNDMPHKALNNKSPNEITLDDEQKYIESMNNTNPYDFDIGDNVRVVLDKNPLKKKRTNLSKVSYTIDSKQGNQFIIRAQDDSIDKMPGYKLIKTEPHEMKAPIASSIKDGKRGIVERIIGYNTKRNTYDVVYEGGVKDTIPAMNMREGNPTKLSRMEREYWIKQKNIPIAIRRWL